MEIMRKTSKPVNLGATTSSLTPETIVGKLFGFHNKAHLYHLQTNTIGKHMLLDELYKSLVDFKDGIAEFLLGAQAPVRFGTIKIDQVEPYSDAALMSFLEEGFQFTIQLCEYAEGRNLEQLCNLSSELQGAFVKAKLFTTYR